MMMKWGCLLSFLVLFIGYDEGFQHWILELRQHSLTTAVLEMALWPLIVWFIRTCVCCCCDFEALSALVVDSHR